MDRYVKTENSAFVRDTISNALINTNAGELNMLKVQRNLAMKNRSEVDSLKRKIEELEMLVRRLTGSI